MLKKDCESCKYKISLIGIGLSVRCIKKENQKYKKNKSSNPILISFIPKGCLFKEEK